MDELISYHSNLLNQIGKNRKRYLFNKLNEPYRLLGIKGLRGVGKTTMFLQYLAHHYERNEEGLCYRRSSFLLRQGPFNYR